jgi:hypothetical protein
VAGADALRVGAVMSRDQSRTKLKDFWRMIGVAVTLLLGGTLIAGAASALVCFLFPVCR